MGFKARRTARAGLVRKPLRRHEYWRKVQGSRLHTLCPFAKHLGQPWASVLRHDPAYFHKVLGGVYGCQLPESMREHMEALRGVMPV